ncbi:hypothetical protein JCM10207_005512 [Rhodosporidiobolus poonsookiae]
MAGRIPVGSALLLTAAITAGGYAIMAMTTPNEQQFYDSLSPDLKRKVDEARKVRQGALEAEQKLRQIKAGAAEDKPVFLEEKKR